MKLKRSALSTAITSLLISTSSFADISVFNRLISLGDSSNDGGTYSNSVRTYNPSAPDINYKFTTNFSDNSAKVTVEYLSQKLNTSIINYAQGGAFVASASAFADPSVGLTAISVKDQIDTLLQQNPKLSSNDIAVFWAGFNNVNAAAIMASQYVVSNQVAIGLVNQAAIDYANQIIRVKNAGAGIVLVNSLFDVSLTPLYSNTPLRSLAHELSINTFNKTLKQNLIGTNVIYIDTAKLLNAMVSDPVRFGFTAPTAATASYNGMTLTPLPTPSPVGNVLGYTDVSNKSDANSYIFTDIGHQTDAAHAIYSQLNYSVLQAIGQQASMLFAPSYTVRQNNNDIEYRLSPLALMQSNNHDKGFREISDIQFWFSGNLSGSSSNATQITPSFSTKATTGTIGLDTMISSKSLLGGSFSYTSGNSKFGDGTGEYDSRLSLATIYSTALISNKIYVNASLQYGDISQDQISRTVFLGPTMITSTGKTNGSYEAARVGLGYIDNYQSWSISPSISFTTAKTKIKGYTESETPVSLAYGDANVRSNLANLSINAQMTGSNNVWLPFFRLSVDRDLYDKPMHVGIGPDNSLLANITVDKPMRTFYTAIIGVQQTNSYGTFSIGGLGTAGSALSNKGYNLFANYKLPI